MSSVDIGLNIIFLIPFIIAFGGPIVMFLAIVIWPVMMIFKAITKLFKKKHIPHKPHEDSPEFLKATWTGYSPDLPLNEIFPHNLDREYIDRIVRVRGVFFPVEFHTAFYDPDNAPDLNPDDLKKLALRLFVEMAFVRSFLLENSPTRWSEKTEKFWIYHTPRPLRKLDPDFYRQLLAKLRKQDQTARAA